MGKIVLSAEMQAKLAGISERQELRDEQGNLLGYFEPAPAPPKKKYEAWGPFTAEEIQRASERKGQYRTLEEIYRDYGHL